MWDFLVLIEVGLKQAFVSQFEKAAGEVLAGLQMREAKEAGEMVEPMPRDVQILLTSREDPVSMRLLGVCLFLVFD